MKEKEYLANKVEEIKKLIDRKHELNKFKLELMPTFPFGNK